MIALDGIQANQTSGTLVRLASIVRPWRRQLGAVAALMLLAALLELVPPLVMQRVIDDHLVAGRAEGLLPLALLYLAATALGEAVAALGVYLCAGVAQRTLHALRLRLFAHFQELPVSYFDRTPLGDALSRCTADIETIDTLFSSGVARVLGDLVRLVTVAIAMVLLSPPLSLASTLVLPALLVVTRFFQVRVRQAEQANREAVGLLNSELQETLTGTEVVAAFERQSYFVARFRRALRRALEAFNRATAYAAFYPPTTATLAAVATAFLLWVGAGPALAAWDISLGTLTAFLLLLQRFFRPVFAIGDEWQTVQGALAASDRIFQVLRLPLDQVGPAEPGIPPASTRSGPLVELSQVSFGYLPERAVLRQFSLSLAPGEQVALVGRTGAGKSSVLHLLGGLYSPWHGMVRVAGRDPRRLDQAERQRLIGAVPQVVQLFAGTVFENLTLFDRSLPRAAVKRAARLAGADGFIQQLPAGYDTLLGGAGRGAGLQLSAGQRQLLALARALVRNPRLLLLDEATAAIDAASDAAFRAALRADRDADQRAVLTVAHRLATACEADRVVLIEAGQIVESGPPAELIRAGGRFAGLVELEAAGWDWRDSRG